MDSDTVPYKAICFCHGVISAVLNYIENAYSRHSIMMVGYLQFRYPGRWPLIGWNEFITIYLQAT